MFCSVGIIIKANASLNSHTDKNIVKNWYLLNSVARVLQVPSSDLKKDEDSLTQNQYSQLD